MDCGIHPGLNGMDALPFVDMIEADKIDLLLVSHFHLDHAGALPWFLQKTTFRGKCFMTHATKAIYRWLLSDFIKVSNISTEQMLYTEQDLEASMDKIETINFHEEREVGGVKFWAYNAGHVLGAAMFMVEIAGVRVLYTGDFSREEDRHLMAAELPSVRPDVLIVESTYGIHIHEKREDREGRFTSTVHEVVARGGRCLIPVFALGRAQELLLILDEYWAAHPQLHEIPIYYASSLAKKCMAVYQVRCRKSGKFCNCNFTCSPFSADVRERHEREDPPPNRRQQPVRLQAHQQPEGHRPLRRRGSLRGASLPRHDAERALEGALRDLVHRPEERVHRGRVLRGGHAGQARAVRAGGDHRHERAEAATQDAGQLHLFLGAHRLQADERVHKGAQAAARRPGSRGGKRNEQVKIPLQLSFLFK